jgi:hypothetical protein
MIDLSGTRRKIPVVSKKLTQGDDIGILLPQLVLERVHIERVRAKSGHEARPARPTERLLTVGPVKTNPHFREALEVRSFYLRISERAQIAVHVIRRNEENIELPLFREGGKTKTQYETNKA